MYIFKKAVTFSLVAIMTLSTSASIAENVKPLSIKEPVLITEISKEKEVEYIEFLGKIKEVNLDNENTSIVVVNDNIEGSNELRVFLGDSVLLSDKTMGFVSKDLLIKGTEVRIFYHKNTPMGLSLPPVLTPNAIVIKESKEPTSVMVSKFDENLLNAEGSLVIHVDDKTIIVDNKGNKKSKEEVLNRNLIIFYSFVMESYPAQTNPEKVIVLPIKESLEEILIKEKEVVIKKELLFINDKNITMIPLRFVAESLGYEVKWDNENRSIELLRGAQWSLVMIGKDSYNFARMYIELGTAPIILSDITYVPLSFAEQVLKGEIVIMENGAVKIIQSK